MTMTKQSKRLVSWLLRPSIWIGIISIIAYWDDTALHGKFVYDDSGSIKNNIVVNGKVPWTDTFRRDFWGTNMTDVQSHKSFRPVTTLTFKLNWLWSDYQLQQQEAGSATTTTTTDATDNNPDARTFGFHLVNVLLHGLVTILVTEAAALVFDGQLSSHQHTSLSSLSSADVIAQIVTGLLFGLHPVHAEAVSNVTSRGELLMSLFCLTAFLSYAHCIVSLQRQQQQQQRQQQHSFLTNVLAIYIVPWLGMTLSMFSKEQGATTLITLVVYDFLYHFESVHDFLQTLLPLQFRAKASPKEEFQTTTTTHKTIASPPCPPTTLSTTRNSAIPVLRRAVVLALQTLLVCGWRYWLNGETSPDFIFDQNPAAFSSDRFTRAFSVTWVYCLYLRDALWPYVLCCDWSGKSIDLVTTIRDPRVLAVLALWSTAACLVYEILLYRRPTTTVLCNNNKQQQQRRRYYRRVLLTAFFGFLVAPFLLSSNILVAVGLMKADRVIYLPLMGFCLLEALLVRAVWAEYSTMPSTTTTTTTTSRSQRLVRFVPCFVVYLLILSQLTLYCRKLHERNVAWSDPLNLWASAYLVNPRSHHTQYNCGYELAMKQRYAEAEFVLRSIGDPHVDGPTTTFVYAMVLMNLQRCEESTRLVDRALRVVDQKEKDRGNTVRDTDSALARARSNLLVAKGMCSTNLKERGRLFYDAVLADQTNTYAVQQATALASKVEQIMKVTPNQR